VTGSFERFEGTLGLRGSHKPTKVVGTLTHGVRGTLKRILRVVRGLWVVRVPTRPSLWIPRQTWRNVTCFRVQNFAVHNDQSPDILAVLPIFATCVIKLTLLVKLVCSWSVLTYITTVFASPKHT
jgi:hypothetical protein